MTEIAEDLPPIDPEVERWARTYCRVWRVKPDKLIGNPAAPRWRSFVNASLDAMTIAADLGYAPALRAIIDRQRGGE